MRPGPAGFESDKPVQHPRAGLGVPCLEAQADGFICPEAVVDCDDCERGRRGRAVRGETPELETEPLELPS